LLAGPRHIVDADIEGCGDLAVAASFAGFALSCSRSSSLTFTTCFFTAIRFAVTKHLRHYGVIASEIDREINDGGY
jgi:hypothetical protein